MATLLYSLSGAVSVTATTLTTSTSTGALLTSGGVSMAKNMYIGGTVSSTSSTTGSVIIGNGSSATSVGIGGGNLCAGAKINTAVLKVTSGTSATSPTTGSVIIGSGTNPFVGIGSGRIFTAGTVVPTSTTSGTVVIGAVASTATCIGIGGGIMCMGGTISSTSTSTTGTLVIGGVTTSTSVSIGAGSLNAGTSITTPQLTLASTTDSSSTNTGALTVVGGVGIAKALTTGLGLYLPTSGGTPSLLNYYESVGFSLAQDTGNSCLGAGVPLTGNFTRVGNTVTATFDNVSGPSQGSRNIATLGASIPTRFLPARLTGGLFNTNVNSVSAWAGGTINSSGVIGIYQNFNQSAFPAGTSTTVGIFDGVMVWTTA